MQGKLPMTTKDYMRVAMSVAVLGASATALTGCLGSPTYGTDKTATEQLFDDLGAAASIRPQQGADIVYQPRPDLVTPPDTTNLPPPQTSLASSEQWPESPEETRDRLRQEADLAGTRAGFQSPLAPRTTFTGRERVLLGGAADGPPPPGSQNNRESQQRFRAAQEVARGTNPTRRNFLSEPPLDYRQPAATAPVGELGESERAKESRRREAAERPGGSRRWWPF
jgi:hypothetical protein